MGNLIANLLAKNQKRKIFLWAFENKVVKDINLKKQ